jgi:hypothetical protein
MVDFKIRIHPEERLAYIPKEICEAMGFELKATPDRRAVLLYPAAATLEDTLRSVDAIREDLKHALEIRNKTAKDDERPHPHTPQRHRT